MATKITIYSDNTTVITLPTVTDAVSGSTISSATVLATLYTPAGVAVTGYTSLSVPAVSGTPGSYSLTLAADPNLPLGRYYFLFTGTTSSAAFELKQDVEVRTRT